MRTFMMDSLPIRSPLAFRTHFSPEDILRDPKLAAAFALHGLAPLSEWDRFNADVLFACAFCWENMFAYPPQAPLDFFASRPAMNCARSGSGERMLRLQSEAPETVSLLTSLWNTACKVNDSVPVRKRIYCILAASYLLARTDPERHPITPEAALAAFRNESPAKTESSLLTLDGGSEPLRIPASRRPYTLAVYPDAPVKRGLSVQKVIAAPHPLGGSVPLVIDLLKNGRKDPTTARVKIPQGDYRYFLLADGVPVRVMPVTIKNGSWILSRSGNMIRLFKGERLLKQAPARDVISICLDILDAETAGWITVTSDRKVDYSGHPYGYNAFGNWDPSNVLEVAVDQGEWWILTDDGDACSRFGDPVAGVADLRSAIRKTYK